MPATQPIRGGRSSQVRARVRAGVAAHAGDLVALIGGKLETFSSAALSPAGFRTSFLGVCAGGTLGTETTDTPALVYTFCTAEYPLNTPALAAVDVGGLVKATADQVVATGGILGVPGTGDAIGRLARRVEVGDTTCLVRIESVVFGGSQPMT